MRYTTIEIAARRNPEQNPKVSAFDYLKEWSTDPDVYISFTRIDKIGINPNSEFGTPLGVYAYPLAVAWDLYNVPRNKSLKVLPFAADRPHIWVIRPSKPQTFIQDLYTDYKHDHFVRDVKILKKLYFEYKGKSLGTDLTDINDPSVNQKVLVNVSDSWSQMFKVAARNTPRVPCAASQFWDFTEKLCYDITGAVYSFNEIKTATLWTQILRKCGYSGFCDASAMKIIHPHEPLQALFLDRNAYKVIGECYNKDYKVRSDYSAEMKRRKI
jgi:hypothetical protein